MSEASTTVVVSAVVKIQTYVTIEAVPANPEVGEQVTIQGFLKRSDNNVGLSNKIVVVSGIPGSPQSVGTTATGEYFATGIVWDAEGTYTVVTTFEGDDEFEGCEKEGEEKAGDVDLLEALD